MNAPNDPFKPSVGNGGTPASDNPSFDDWMGDLDTLHRIHNPNFPEQGSGTHVPMWVTPKLAHDLLRQHGHTGHVFPHPNLKLKGMTR